MSTPEWAGHLQADVPLIPTSLQGREGGNKDREERSSLCPYPAVISPISRSYSLYIYHWQSMIVTIEVRRKGARLVVLVITVVLVSTIHLGN